MDVIITNTIIELTEHKCIDCKSKIESVHIEAMIPKNNPHKIYMYSCPQCPNITFEFCDERDLAVLQTYLLNNN